MRFKFLTGTSRSLEIDSCECFHSRCSLGFCCYWSILWLIFAMVLSCALNSWLRVSTLWCSWWTLQRFCTWRTLAFFQNWLNCWLCWRRNLILERRCSRLKTIWTLILIFIVFLLVIFLFWQRQNLRFLYHICFLDKLLNKVNILNLKTLQPWVIAFILVDLSQYFLNTALLALEQVGSRVEIASYSLHF